MKRVKPVLSSLALLSIVPLAAHAQQQSVKSAVAELRDAKGNVVGQCAPSFAAAGGHFNPAGHKHGFLSKDGHHSGDLPNIMADVEGNATYEVKTSLVTLADGANSLSDQDGSAIVIHAGPDDYHSDPAGASGDHIAWGVITRQ